VTDASILFDAVKGGILHEMFQLPFTFVTSDFITDRELKNPPFSEFKSEGLIKEELSGSQINAMSQIRTSHKNLSIYDISAFILARDHGITLLTGDNALREYAEASGIQVHGILWILDELVRNKIITQKDAAIALQEMLDHECRLPKKECDARFAQWKKDIGYTRLETQ
jgi:predicted nucleic acid-binding protein